MTTLPAMTAAQEASWHALFDLAERFPTGWTLIGGQLVQLHCAEREVRPTRPTADADAALDVRKEPQIFTIFTEHLEAIGFNADRETIGGRQHRWVRGDAIIDVLIPTGLGRRSDIRSSSGKPGLETGGAQHALNRTERAEITVGNRTGLIPRPTLLGALIIKGAAWGNTLDALRERHLSDFATLASLLTARDLRNADLSKSERAYLRKAVTDGRGYDRLGEIAGAADGLKRLALAVDSRRIAPELGEQNHEQDLPATSSVTETPGHLFARRQPVDADR